MKIHEYQAKELFRRFGIPTSKGVVVTDPADATRAAAQVGYPCVVKAQVHVGGRGKAGGVKLARNEDELKRHAAAILGMDIKGLVVERVLLDEAVEIARELSWASSWTGRPSTRCSWSRQRAGWTSRRWR